MKFDVPSPITNRISHDDYNAWLVRKARAQVKRDKKRSKKHNDAAFSLSQYCKDINNAVVRSGGMDEYTGKPLDWELCRKYNNLDSAKEGTAYLVKFRNLPTVDHEFSSNGEIYL